MKWMDWERLRKDFHQIIQENQEGYPLYGFLSFLMNTETTPEMQVTVSSDFWKQNIQRLVIQFKGEHAVTFDMGELPTFDYDWFMKRPEMLLEHFQKDIQLESARSQYDKIQQKFDRLEELRVRGNCSDLPGRIRFEDIMITMDLNSLIERRRQPVIHGALFSERLSKLYQEYLEMENQPQAITAPAPEMSPPVHDIIEVELLTILEDPDISELTKSDAKETLEVYRQENVTVKRNPKEENALLAIQTIRQHYTKGGSWT